MHMIMPGPSPSNGGGAPSPSNPTGPRGRHAQAGAMNSSDDSLDLAGHRLWDPDALSASTPLATPARSPSSGGTWSPSRVVDIQDGL
jgi:hypothetical protein